MLQVWDTFEDPTSSRTARFVSIGVLVTIGVSVVSFVVGTAPDRRCTWEGSLDPTDLFAQRPRTRICPKGSEGRLRLGERPAMQHVESACVAIFTLEYLCRLLSARAVMPLRRFVTGVRARPPSEPLFENPHLRRVLAPPPPPLPSRTSPTLLHSAVALMRSTGPVHARWGV